MRGDGLKRQGGTLVTVRWMGLLWLSAAALWGQPRFEVAVIKPSRPGGGGFISKLPGGRFHAERVPIGFLVTYAYALSDREVVDLPKWCNSELFDVDATPEGDAGSEPVARDVMVKKMLRTLLAERCGLVVHPETRELSAFFITVAKGGPKLRATVLPPGPEMVRKLKGAVVSLDFKAAPMPYVAQMLGGQLNEIVVDGTGLSGAFDFTLEWARPPRPSADPAVVPEREGPSLTEAMQSDLGLRIDRRKGPVEVLVVDSVERPSAN